jgi:predicted MFS family arabinose efflux permease
MGLIPRVGTVSLGYVGVIAMASIWRTPIVVYRMEIVPPRWRALISGTSNMSLGVSYAITGLGGAYIAQNAGYSSVFLAGAVLTALGTLLFWLFDRVPRGEFSRPVVPQVLQ